MLAVPNPRGWPEVPADVGPDAPGQRKDHASDRCCFFCGAVWLARGGQAGKGRLARRSPLIHPGLCRAGLAAGIVEMKKHVVACATYIRVFIAQCRG